LPCLCTGVADDLLFRNRWDVKPRVSIGAALPESVEISEATPYVELTRLRIRVEALDFVFNVVVYKDRVSH
jgi:hypothetical protein